MLHSIHAHLARLSSLLCFLLCSLWSPGASAEEDALEDEGQTWSPPHETEFSMVPFVGGSSDTGFGGGYIASLARLRQDRKPYVYRIDTTGSVTFDESRQGGVHLPYVDVFLRWRFPHVIANRLGVELRASYTRETNLGYYGLGNASALPSGLERGDPYFEYSRVHPTLTMSWELQLKPLFFSWGSSYTGTWLDVPPDTLLASDFQSERPYVRELTGNARQHGVPKFSLGVAWDTRDDEVAPIRGMYLSEELALTPGTFGDAWYRFARSTSTARAYFPLIPQHRRLVLATRLVADLLLGNAPFYELARYDDTSAIGGSRGVRGVPAQRYYGKIKLIGNVELRSELLELSLLGAKRRFGLVAFVDTGRVWADYASHPDLDGTGPGLAYGVGGGLRIASGKTFLLRFDLAWSPDARSSSGYLLAGHVF
jgi:outer membrane protein assembly factor BamA